METDAVSPGLCPLYDTDVFRYMLLNKETKESGFGTGVKP